MWDITYDREYVYKTKNLISLVFSVLKKDKGKPLLSGTL